jgi:hypothetical protein
MTILRSYYSTWKRDLWGPLATLAMALLLIAGIAADVRAGKESKADYETPATPTGFNLYDSATYGLIYLNWNEPTYTTVFELWRAENEAGPYTLQATVNAPTTEYRDNTVECGTTYFYKIRAGNCCFFSNFTLPIEGTALPCSIAVDSCDQVTEFISSDFTEYGTTAGASNDSSPSTHNCFHAGTNNGYGPDVVYGIQTESDCYVKITTSSSFPYVLKSACDIETVCVDTRRWALGSTEYYGFRAEAGESYFVVIEDSEFFPDYSIDFKFFGCGEALPTCSASNPLDAQPPAAYGSTYGVGYDTREGMLDNFSTDGSPIHRVTWWGTEVKSFTVQPCESVPTGFDIEFYGAGPTPGALAGVYSVEATVVDTGAEFQYYPLLRFEAELPAPFVATNGWIRIVANNVQNCYWQWLGSANGDYNAVVDTNPLTFESVDLAFCLSGESVAHTADQSGDGVITLSELLRVIQFYNSLGLHCGVGTEDGYVPGSGVDTSCTAHASDYNPQDWVISLSELLRVIQFYNSLGYYSCPGQGTEDSYCPGTGP